LTAFIPACFKPELLIFERIWALTKHIVGASYTHTGRIKENNEDAISLLIPQPKNGIVRGLLMVADGVGGHLAGEVASNLAVQTVSEMMHDFIENGVQDNGDKPITHNIEPLLKRAVEKANCAIFEYSTQNKTKAGNLGTTTTAGVIFEDELVIAHVGDSRAYRLRGEELFLLTNDHTFVGEMVRQGQFSSDAYYEHPKRHVITRALGQKPEVEVDIYKYKIQSGDKFVFCSDGVWEMVRDEEIKNLLLSATSPKNAVDRLFVSAMEAGGVDNFGVVVGEIREG
jgi:protein phosphatase